MITYSIINYMFMFTWIPVNHMYSGASVLYPGTSSSPQVRKVYITKTVCKQYGGHWFKISYPIQSSKIRITDTWGSTVIITNHHSLCYVWWKCSSELHKVGWTQWGVVLHRRQRLIGQRESDEVQIWLVHLHDMNVVSFC